MCIAILKTKKGNITDEQLRNSFISNSDGAGIAYTVKGNLIIEKGIFEVNKFIQAVRRAEAKCDNNMLIHCRIGTSGYKDKKNTHPFKVTKNVCLIHNGILDVHVPKNSDINDTQIFINEYMKDLSNEDLINNNGVKTLLKGFIGTYNKFVLLDNNGNYNIINEKQGHWLDGVWYSNYSYATHKTSSYTRYWFDSYYDEDYALEGYPEDGTTSGRKISKETYDDILMEIESLTLTDIAGIGYDPQYDFVTGKLSNVETNISVPLRNLSKELYDYYFDLCEESNYVSTDKTEEVYDLREKEEEYMVGFNKT